jgi:hypothetical protein
VSIQINSPAHNATVPVLLSVGRFTVRGGVAVIGDATFDKIEVRFGNSPRPVSGSSSWTCTSGTIAASGPLKITARALNKNNIVLAEHSIDVKVVVTDDVGPVITITQPAENWTPGIETNGVLTVAFNGTATDSMSGIKRVQFGLTAQGPLSDIVAPSSPLPSTVNWGITKVTLPSPLPIPGQQAIWIRAIDGVDNERLGGRTFLIDKTGPTLKITDPITDPEQESITLPGTDAGATLPLAAGHRRRLANRRAASHMGG